MEYTCSGNEHFGVGETIVEDFNTDVSKGNHSLARKLNHFGQQFGLTQTINDHTQVTATSKSIIDLVLILDKDKISQSGAINAGISDHFITYCTQKIPEVLFNSHNAVKA